VPRAGTAEELADEIDKVFSDWKHKDGIVERCQKYIEENTWSRVADKYLAIYPDVLPASGVLTEIK
jgi:glycosyltransferase involved in cell wall biosynthesis